MSQKRLDKWYHYLEGFCGNDPQILKLRRKADGENKKDFFYIVKIPHNYFWSAIHLFIVGAGFFLFTMYPKPPSKKKEHHCCQSTISVDTNKTYIDTTKIKKYGK